MFVHVLRWALAVVVGAFVAAAALRAFAPPTVEASVAIAALAVPTVVVAGDDVIAFGATTSGAGAEDERHWVACAPAGGCRASAWGGLRGPSAWHGYAGTVPTGAPGPVEVTWVLDADIGLDGGRAVAVASAIVSVVASLEVTHATP